jgi:IS30 family transposase
MWSCFKPQIKKNTKEFKGRYSPSSEVSEQRIGQLERDSGKNRQHLDWLHEKVMALHQHTPSPTRTITQKVEQTSVFLQSNPLYKHLMLEYSTHMEQASNTALRKAFDLRNTNLETQTAERGGSWSGVRFEQRSRDIPPIQRASSTSSVNANIERKFRRLDPNFV